MDIITDFGQSEKNETSSDRLGNLEIRPIKSRILVDLIGENCIIHIGCEIFKGRVTDVDEVWMKIIVAGKKSETVKVINTTKVDEIEIV